jgi:hypothetical protein
MSTLFEAPSTLGEPEQLSPVRQILQDIRGMDDPNDQFLALCRRSPYSRCRLPYAKDTDIEGIDALLDFAADSDSSGSLLVRAQALEAATDSLLEWERTSDETDFLGRSAMFRRYMDLCWLLPRGKTLASISREASAIRNPLHSDSDIDARPYRHVIAKLAEKEGIRKEIIYPDWAVLDYPDGNENDDATPTTALFTLEKLAEIQNIPHQMPVNEVVKLVPLALDIRAATEAGNVQIDPRNEKFLRIDSQHITEFLQRDKAETAPYESVLTNLYVSAIGLQKIFPAEYRVGIRRSAQSLLASALYAIKAHLENGGETHVTIALNVGQGRGLELNMVGDEPLETLEALAMAMWQLNEQITSPDTCTTLTTAGKGYRQYRLWPADRKGSNISVYIRPFGDEIYDSEIEYGKNGKGVLASIQYDIAPFLEEGKISKAYKHRGDNTVNQINIRIDREGVLPEQWSDRSIAQDPTQQQGTLSLDFGSVFGHESQLGTKVGRLLAWGNVLRSNAANEQPQLNHVVHYFSAEEGRADVFAGEAMKLARQLESRRIKGQRAITKRLARIAVANL